MLPYRKEAAEEADSKAAFIRIHLPGHSVSAAVLWGYLRIQCAIARFPTLILGKGAGKPARMQKISTVHELEMKMGEHGIATVSDAADKISCFDILSNSHRNRIRLQVTEGGIDRIRILDYYGISADFTYFLVLPATTVFKSHQGIREKPGAFSFSAAIHHIYNPSITWGIHRQSIAIARR